MKKNHVAIVSYNIHSDHLNYGAALHSYAFQQYLLKNGIDSTIIDYFPLKIEMENKNLKYPILSMKKHKQMSYYKNYIVNWGVGFFANIRKYNKFVNFFDDHCKTTNKTYFYSDLMRLDQIENIDFSCFVCESDVIWKTYPNFSLDNVFLLNIPSAEGKKKVAYAPTVGAYAFSSDEEFLMKEVSKKFCAISTRERQGAEYLTAILNRHVEWFLDPTLLLTDEDYLRIVKRPLIEEPYILLYNCIHNDHKMVEEAEKLAKKMGKKLVEVSNWTVNKILYNHKVVNDAGIEEWLGLFKYADMVICNAFHGFCFSVIFKKEVVLFVRDTSDYRMQNITEALGMSDRLISISKRKYRIIYLLLIGMRFMLN